MRRCHCFCFRFVVVAIAVAIVVHYHVVRLSTIGPVSVLQGSRNDVASSLRQCVAQRWSEKPPEDVLHLYLELAGQEQASLEHWHDEWTPSDVMLEHGFVF